MNRYIRFDWAAKHILRSKADFVVFEGLISVLVGEKVTIVELLDSESNKDSRDDKYNRVDIKALNSKGEIILVEIQQTREHDYLQRMLYGVAKAITEHMQERMPYEKVKKVFSINILYFTMGEGEDYLYHGQTVLKGVHKDDTLRLTDHERNDLKVVAPENVFPEYYVIRVNEFDKPILENYQDEWMDYLKNERIRTDTTAPGLREARQKLEVLEMTPQERREYEHYMDTLIRDTDVMKTQLLEAEIAGRKKGLAEGRTQGLAEGRTQGLAEGRTQGLAEGRTQGLAEGRNERSVEIARKMKAMGMSVEQIAELTGLGSEEIVIL